MCLPVGLHKALNVWPWDFGAVLLLPVSSPVAGREVRSPRREGRTMLERHWPGYGEALWDLSFSYFNVASNLRFMLLPILVPK